ALDKEINLNYKKEGTIGISCDELTSVTDINNIIEIFAEVAGKPAVKVDLIKDTNAIPENLKRKSAYLTEKVFNMFQRLLTNNPKKIIGLEGYGLQVTGRVPIECVPRPENIRYLSTKCHKLGHLMKRIE
ncbi:MAG: hypothetical protein R6X27_19790, partial [Candidatus Desulfacyla sp.]